MYVLNSKELQIPMGKFHLIDLNQTQSKQKSQIQHQGQILIRKSYHDSALFDLFLLDQFGLQCYLSIYYNSSWEQPCFFQYNISQTKLQLINYTYQYEIDSTIQQYIVIDNTYFPLEGAYYDDDLYLNIEYQQTVQPIPTYYSYTIKIGIVLVGVLVCFLLWCILLLVKYKKELKSQNEKLKSQKEQQEVQTKAKKKFRRF
ncbi:hypothetical protein pb186bvf_017462 [Paramecium bursaria]